MPTAKQKQEKKLPAQATPSASTPDPAGALFRRIEHIETKVIAKRWPPLSEFWRETLSRFARSGRRQLVIRAGRRAGKSSSLCRFAVAYALWFATLGKIPPGDVGYVVFVSVSRKEAQARLRTIKQLLDTLGIEYQPDGDFIALKSFNVGFGVLTGSVRGVSGWTSILIICDEVSKWLDEDSGANPADEVLAALRPTGATTKAPVILSSSPMTDDDAHARAFNEGENEFQITASAPTWVANPTITEEESHKLERDERVWRREYAAIPQPALLDGYLADVVDPCVDKDRKVPHPRKPEATYVIALDPAWRRDEFAVAILRAETNPAGLPQVVVEDITGWRGEYGKPLSVENVVERIDGICTQWGTRTVYSDQKDVDTLRALLERRKINLVGVPWTSSNKTAKFRLFRSLCMDRRIELLNEPTLLKQLESICIKLTPNGTETFQGRGSDDRAFAVVLGTAEAVALAPLRVGAPSPELGANFETQSLDLHT